MAIAMDVGATAGPEGLRSTPARVRSHCQQCMNSCGIVVEVRDGKPIRISGDIDDPNTRGHLCARGISGVAKFYDLHRVKTPLIRTNPRKGRGIDPKWRPASWDEALDLVAAKFRAIRADNRDKLICSFFAYEKFVQTFAWPNAFGTTNGGFCFSGISNQCANPSHITGTITHGAWNEFPDLKYCNFLIQLGSEFGFGAHQAFVRMAREMADARARGMRLVVADPRLSVAAGKADEWLPIRPASDLAFLVAMIRLLIHEYGLYDAAWLKHGTNAPYLLGPDRNFLTDPATGKPLVWDPTADGRAGGARTFDDPTIGDFALEGRYTVNGVACLPAFQDLKDGVRDYTSEWAETLCDIPAATIRRLSREFGEAARIGETITIDGVEYPFRPVALLSYRGLQAHTNGTLAILAQETVMMLLGALGVPGGPLPRSMDGRRYGGAPRLLATGPDGMVRALPNGWHLFTPFTYPPRSLELREYGPLALDMGHLVPLTMMEPEKYGIPYRPEALLMYHTNPFTNAGDSAVIEKALMSLDMVVSINIYLDESTDFADVVLPEHTYLERDNLINFSHDMRGLQIGQPVVPPLHDTKDGMDILIELADRSGFLDGPGGYNAAINRLLELEDGYRLDTERKYTYAEILDLQARCHSDDAHDLEWYREHGNDFRPLKPDQIYRIYRGARLPLFFNYIKDVGDDLKANLEKHEIEKKFGLRINTDVYKGIPYWEPSPVHAEDGYDFYLISYKNYMTTFADTATNPILMEVSRRDPLLMKVVINAATAKARGIRNGDPVWVESRYAKATGIAGVTEGVHPRTAAISGGFGRWTGHPVAHGKGIAQNPHLPIDLAHTGMLGGSMETVGKVNIYRA